MKNKKKGNSARRFLKTSRTFIIFGNNFLKIGFGRIFEAIDIENNLKVSLKERKKNDKRSIENWKKEIENLKRIEKEIPNLITPKIKNILDENKTSLSLNESAKQKYLVMEWVEGKDFTCIRNLFQKFSSEKEKEIELSRLIYILLDELSKMHLAKFLHRDIKLENLMFLEKNNQFFYIFIDFGSSFHIEDPIHSRIATASPPFSPPEQNSEKECFLSDVYSLGVCFEKVFNIISFKSKISPLLIEMISSMKKREIENRISVEKCKEIIQKFLQQELDKEFSEEKFKNQSNLFKF